MGDRSTQQLLESRSDARFEVALFTLEFELHFVLFVGQELCPAAARFSSRL